MTGAGITLYIQVLWDPVKLIDHWDNRAAVFFTAFAFALATPGTNISANSLSARNDMTALWQRYINIWRGQVICAFLGGWADCPWGNTCEVHYRDLIYIRDSCLICKCPVRWASYLL